MAITKIKIENLTVFEDMEMDIKANVNVFIGENGTGKTHLLKFIYAIFSSRDRIEIHGFKVARLEKGYEPDGFLLNVGDLINNWDASEALFNIDFNNNFRKFLCRKFPIDIELVDGRIVEDEAWRGEIIFEQSDEEFENLLTKMVFIPAKDMLTHSHGFLSMEKKYKMPFDKTLVDILAKASGYELKEIPEIAKSILPKLEKIMEGIVIIERDEFFILKSNGKKISFDLEAEGLKKIGLLWKLLMTDNIKPGTVLLWDEPEANMNPKLIPVLAEIILELGCNGVQIFLATHDGLLAEYLEHLKSEKDSVAFHALYKTDNGVQCETETKFTLLEKNAIIDEKISLYKKIVEKGLE